MSDTNVHPDTEGPRLHGCFWLDPGWGKPNISESGGIHFHPRGNVTLAFQSLDDLDAVIGELTTARYAAAVEMRQRTEKAKAGEHYAGVLADAQAESEEVAV